MSGNDSGQLQGVGADEAAALLAGGAVLVDVREDLEWQAGHAPVARHIPLGQLQDRVDELKKDDRLVVVCRAGQRSARATAFLVESGFDAVNLDGGMHAWDDAGLPIEASDGSAGVVA